MPTLIDIFNLTNTQQLQITRAATALNHEEVYRKAALRLAEIKRDILATIDSGRAILADGQPFANERAARYVIDAAKGVNDRMEAWTDAQIDAAVEAFLYVRPQLDEESARFGLGFLYSAANRLATLQPDGSDLVTTLNAIDGMMSRPDQMG